MEIHLQFLGLSSQCSDYMTGVALLEAIVKTQGNCLYYAHRNLHSLHTVDGICLLDHGKPPW